MCTIILFYVYGSLVSFFFFLLECMPVHQMYSWCPEKSEEGCESSVTEL